MHSNAVSANAMFYNVLCEEVECKCNKLEDLCRAASIPFYEWREASVVYGTLEQPYKQSVQ